MEKINLTNPACFRGKENNALKSCDKEGSRSSYCAEIDILLLNGSDVDELKINDMIDGSNIALWMTFC